MTFRVSGLAVPGCEGPSAVVKSPTIRCFVAKSVMSRTMREGSQKMTNDDEGEGGSRYPPKMMMSFMKSHLCVVCVSHKCYTCFICVVCVSYMCYTCRPVNYRLLDRRAAGVVISHRS